MHGQNHIKYSSTLSLTSARDGGGWSAPRPGRSSPEKGTRYPLLLQTRRYQYF